MGVAAPHAAAAALGTELSWGGNIAVTSDYIYRGVSESDGRAALQADLHADTPGGTFAGAWASTRDRSLEPGSGYDFEIYLGHRFDLGSACSALLHVDKSGATATAKARLTRFPRLRLSSPMLNGVRTVPSACTSVLSAMALTVS